MKITKEELETVIREVAESCGDELVEVKLGRHGKKHFLRVFAYRTGGITLDQCSELSRALSRRLDELDPFDNAYQLEVSSPGLDRKLVTIEDFRRSVGENLMLHLIEPGEHGGQIDGRLAGVKDDMLILETGRGTVELEIGNIKLGKIVF